MVPAYTCTQVYYVIPEVRTPPLIGTLKLFLVVWDGHMWHTVRGKGVCW